LFGWKARRRDYHLARRFKEMTTKKTPVLKPKPDQKQSKFKPDDDRRITHGAYSERMRQRYSDARTPEGRQLKATMDDLVSDLGGHENLTADQRINLDSIRSMLIVLRRIGEFVDRQESIIKDGQLLPVLGKNYLAYLNTLRLTLAELYKDHGKRQKGPDLKDYIEAKYGDDK
jgi:hypothetical protein